MAKFLMLWRLNPSLVPADPKDRGGGWELLMGLIKADMGKGVIKDWGAFTSEGAGYSIMEGSNVEVMKATEQYVPYVFFDPHPVSTVDDVNQLIKAMTK